MRLFAIRDDVIAPDMILGYLVYYELSRCFYVELPDDSDPWKVPPVFSSFVSNGRYTIDSSFSRLFVRQRIVPQDRQNISQILVDNGLKEYDEFALLMLSMGHCEQDECYLEEVSSDAIPQFIQKRWETKVLDISPLETPSILVFFRNSMSKIVDVSKIAPSQAEPFLINQSRFDTIEVQPDGYGIYWTEQASVLHSDLFTHGVTAPLSLHDFHRFVQNRVVSASEACTILNCSRQNIDDLMRRGKLHPIRTDAKYKIFSRTEVMQRKKG